MDENNELLDSEIQNDENADSINGEEVDVEALKTQLEETKEKNKKLFERVKKAEGFTFQDGAWVKPESKPEVKPESKPEGISLRDVMEVRALSDVHEDSMEWLVKWAKFNNLTIAEAKKTKEAQAILAIQAEERKTAQTTNIGKTGGMISKKTGDTLLERAYATGETPTDLESARLLVQARIAEKLGKKS